MKTVSPPWRLSLFIDAKRVDAADDLTTLGLDMLVGEGGWSRHASNPPALVGKPAGLFDLNCSGV